VTDQARRTATLVAGAILAAFLVLVVASLSSGGDGNSRSVTDGAFIAGMVPHHNSAVQMARVALDRSQRRAVRRLAQDIVDSQTEEMSMLRSIHQRLYGAPLSSMSAAHGSMPGMSEKMAVSPADLEAAPEFDRAFLDAMVSHHEDAIRMARLELADGRDAELRGIARGIIQTQSREITKMRRWRERWYGAA
jgi:uncharacterized protein (DUF305 family)